MIFTPEEIIKFKRACQEIIDKPRPMDEQPSSREDSFLWCEDWALIEILKYYFLGHETYHTEAPPNRLKENPLWSKKQVEGAAKLFLDTHKTVDGVIEHLRGIRNGTASWLA